MNYIDIILIMSCAYSMESKYFLNWLEDIFNRLESVTWAKLNLIESYWIFNNTFSILLKNQSLYNKYTLCNQLCLDLATHVCMVYGLSCCNILLLYPYFTTLVSLSRPSTYFTTLPSTYFTTLPSYNWDQIS